MLRLLSANSPIAHAVGSGGLDQPGEVGLRAGVDQDTRGGAQFLFCVFVETMREATVSGQFPDVARITWTAVPTLASRDFPRRLQEIAVDAIGYSLLAVPQSKRASSITEEGRGSRSGPSTASPPAAAPRSPIRSRTRRSSGRCRSRAGRSARTRCERSARRSGSRQWSPRPAAGCCPAGRAS